MAVTIKLTGVVKSGNSIFVNWEDGSQTEYASVDQLTESLAELSADTDLARKFLLAWWIARSPNASDVNVVEGKTLVLDLSASQPIEVQ